jgi:hypothetical protein
MSCNEWERGEIKIPGAQWKQVRDGITLAVNARQKALYELALKAYDRLVEIKKIKGSKALEGGASGALMMGDRADQALLSALESSDDSFHALHNLFKADPVTRKQKLVAPKKKDFPDAVSTKATHHGLGGFGITINHAGKTITWSVPENNHAVDNAHEHPVGIALFRLLKGVKWTRGTGGIIAGNNEYARDNQEYGGASNFANFRFGPLGEWREPIMHRRTPKSTRQVMRA